MIENLSIEAFESLKSGATDTLKVYTKDKALQGKIKALDKAVGGTRLKDYIKSNTTEPEAHNVYEQLAVCRFFEHLKKYDFRVDKVRGFVMFFEHLPLPGPKGRVYTKCSPVQLFQFCNIYGFYVPGTNKRVIREALLFVPRKYGKTTTCGAMALYDSLLGDYDAEAYISANSYQQAQICYKGISEIVKLLDSGGGRFRMTRDTVDVKLPGRESRIRCLSNSPTRLDGLKASVSISDELSQADSFATKNVISTSMGTRENPLVIDITTASEKTESPFVDELEAYKRILRKETEDDNVFAHIFEPDMGDEESDPATWKKVNPHIGVTVALDFYEAEYKKALRSYDNLVAFRTKLLNVFVFGTQASWMPADDVYRCMQDFDWRDTSDPEYGVCAFDLSIKDDFSAVTFMTYDEEEQTFRSKTKYYFPEGQMERHVNKPLYEKWAEEGWLTLIPGNVIDYHVIATDILEMAERIVIMKIGYDPYRDAELINELKAAGAGQILQPIGQTRSNFTACTGQMEIIIDNDAIVFDRNPITPWCFGNAVIDEDNNSNRKPMKKNNSSAYKIDGVITNLMCVRLFADLKAKK